jgi:hypothetical protein
LTRSAQQKEIPVTDVVWREPPARPGRRHRFAQEAAQMREHPGEWLLLGTFPLSQSSSARSMGNSIRIGRYTTLRPAGAFDYQTATEDAHDSKGKLTRVVNVYARYVGEGYVSADT